MLRKPQAILRRKVTLGPPSVRAYALPAPVCMENRPEHRCIVILLTSSFHCHCFSTSTPAIWCLLIQPDSDRIALWITILVSFYIHSLAQLMLSASSVVGSWSRDACWFSSSYGFPVFLLMMENIPSDNFCFLNIHYKNKLYVNNRSCWHLWW